jgi:hypothetical protein
MTKAPPRVRSSDHMKTNERGRVRARFLILFLHSGTATCSGAVFGHGFWHTHVPGENTCLVCNKYFLSSVRRPAPIQEQEKWDICLVSAVNALQRRLRQAMIMQSTARLAARYQGWQRPACRVQTVLCSKTDSLRVPITAAGTIIEFRGSLLHYNSFPCAPYASMSLKIQSSYQRPSNLLRT